MNASYEVTSLEGAFCLYGCITVLVLLVKNELTWLMSSEPSDAEAKRALEASLHFSLMPCAVHLRVSPVRAITLRCLSKKRFSLSEVIMKPWI